MTQLGAGYCVDGSVRVAQAAPYRTSKRLINFQKFHNYRGVNFQLLSTLVRTLGAGAQRGRAPANHATQPSSTASTEADGAAASQFATAAAAAPPPPRPPLPPDLLLSDIRVVLVAPKHEANIGAVARACANFECVSLYLVAPRCAADPQGEARKVACGDAVLDRMVVTATLAEALADTAGSIGFTRRAGAARVTHASLGHLVAEFPWALPLRPAVAPPPSAAEAPVVLEAPPSSAAEAPVVVEAPPPSAAEAPQATGAGSPVYDGGGDDGGDGVVERSDRIMYGGRPHVTALVFGREESGLTEAELRLCSHACAIPTGRLQPSMNLSHAVAVVLAELFSRRCGLLNVASAAEVEQAAAEVDSACDGTRLLQLPTSSTGISGDAGVGREPSGDNADGATASTSSGATAADVGASVGAGASGGGGAGEGSRSMDAGQLPASAQETELLLRKVAAVAEAVGISGQETKGGGNHGNHGRRRLPLGHLRAVVSRARLNAGESRALHGLASAVLQRVDPEHPLEARKAQRRGQQRPQEEQQQRSARQEQQEGQL